MDAFHRQIRQAWSERLAGYTDETYRNELDAYESAMDTWRKNGSVPPAPERPEDPRADKERPGNLYCGMVNPIIGYGIRGIIWYQGEANAGRAYQYRISFPLLIEALREDWGQGDFPFCWVQLAGYIEPRPQPDDSVWTELREAQTMALDLPETGEAVIIDTGESNNIHPHDKQTVANRLAMLALNKTYGDPIPCESPRYASMEVSNGKIILTFDDVDQGLTAFDTDRLQGFAIAGDDQDFVWAQAEIIPPDQIVVWSENVPAPIVVRYAWDYHPVNNVIDRNGLPLAPFRTDDWPVYTQTHLERPRWL